MAARLRFGADSFIEIDPGPDHWLTVCDAPHGEPLDDPAKALAEALAAPLDFPALGQAIIPGDRVVIALGDEVPQAGVLTAGLVEALLHASVGAADICVLMSASSARAYQAELDEALPESVRRRIEVAVHDPHVRDHLSYLGADHHGEAVYINRRLFDADVVLPVGCIRADGVDYFGVNGALYPTFSDQAAIERFGASGRDGNDIGGGGASSRRRKEADEVAWLLGVLLTIQVVPGTAGEVLHVVAGNVESVQREGSELCRAAWECATRRRAELVIAAIEGDERQQTWENIGRAVAAASRVVAEGGTIAVCCEVADAPGPAIQALSGAQDFDEAMRALRNQHSPDAAAAHELAQALDSNRIYLLSRLDEALVEDLGLAPVSSAEEISRLAQRRQSCLLLANAQFAQPHLIDEPVGQVG